MSKAAAERRQLSSDEAAQAVRIFDSRIAGERPREALVVGRIAMALGGRSGNAGIRRDLVRSLTMTDGKVQHGLTEAEAEALLEELAAVGQRLVEAAEAKEAAALEAKREAQRAARQAELEREQAAREQAELAQARRLVGTLEKAQQIIAEREAGR